MNVHSAKWLRCVLLVGVGLVWACSSPGQVRLSGKLKNFQFPDYYEPAPGQTNQVMKTLLSGAEAQQLPNGQVQISGLRIDSYRPDGQREVEVRAASCVFDMTTRAASGAGHLEVSSASGLYAVAGEGFLWGQSDGVLIISNDVVSTLNRGVLATRGSQLNATTNVASTATVPTNSVVTITSDHCVFDNQSNIVTQSGNVVANDPQMRLACDVLRVAFTADKRLEEIRARGQVSILNKPDQSRATSGQALYLVTPEKESVTLTDHPFWQDRTGRQTVSAKVFVYDLTDKAIRAERDAVMHLPRGSFSQPSLVLEAGPLNHAPSSPSSGTNQIQITSEAMTILLASTNRPYRSAVAETNVVILSPADDTRAVGDEARFSEATGRLELLGHAQWAAEGRLVKADTLTMDRTNRVFSGHGHSFFKLPLSQVGQDQLFAASTNRVASTNLFLEVVSDDFNYRSNRLTFVDHVRARLLETNTVRGQITCERLTAHFSERLDSVLAERRVLAEQFPGARAGARSVTNMLSCGVLSAKVSETGRVIALVAAENVQAAQVELRTNRPQAVVTELTCGVLTAVVLPKTGQVDKLHAERHVVVSQGDKLARGEDAVYTAQNNKIELTGEPYAEFAEGKVRDAKVLIWDRTAGTFGGRGRYQIELKKPLGNGPNTSRFFLPEK